MYKHATYSIMELMLLWVSKGFLKTELLLPYLLILTIILSKWLYSFLMYTLIILCIFLSRELGTVVGLTSS